MEDISKFLSTIKYVKCKKIFILLVYSTNRTDSDVVDLLFETEADFGYRSSKKRLIV